MNNNEYKKRQSIFKERVSVSVLILFDLFVIFASLFLSIVIKALIYNENLNIQNFSILLTIYSIIICIFFYEGIYTNRFDFWHEYRKILKSLVLSFVTILSFCVLISNSSNYDIETIIYSFIFMTIFIPLFKYILKIKLFKLGYWKKGVKVLSENAYLEKEILGNPYLGYIKSKRKDAEFVFVDSFEKDTEELKRLIEREILLNRKVLFIPIFNNYQFSSSDIYELTDSRTSLIVLENKLKSSSRIFINTTYNILLALCFIPLILPIVGIIAFLINQDSKGPIFYRQKRLGLDGKEFMVFKFRTMYTEDIQEKLLSDYLDENPEEIKNYEIYCKYNNDPRITKVGNFLRKTSLDELAQIFNVLKGEMNFVGPRPYLIGEKEKMGKYNNGIILKVKPGITGLWQVSGRNELTFDERVNLEKWYVQNWSLWNDFVILLKTVGVVLNKVGAK